MADAKIVITAETAQAQRALGDVQRSLGNLLSVAGGAGSSIGGALAGAFKTAAAAAAVLGLGMGVAAKKAVDAASEMQNLRIRLDALGGSSEAGAKSLEVINNAALKLPFSLKEIANASTSLITVSKDTNDLSKNIQLTADIAAASGLSFQDTAQQIQRAFSAGAASADMFRERGILASAGFQAGVTYSVEETRKKFEEFGKTIEGVSQKLNNTLTGALSQLGDQFQRLQVAFGTPISTALGTAINLLVDDLNKASAGATNLATELGEKFALKIADFIDGVALAADALYGWYKTMKPLIDIALKLAFVIADVVVRAFGIAMFAATKLASAVGYVTDAFGLTVGAGEKLRKLGDIGLELSQKGLPGLEDAAKKALGTVAGGTDVARQSLGKYSKAIRDSIAEQRKLREAGAKPLPNNVVLPSGDKAYERDKVTAKLILDLELSIVNAKIMDNTTRYVGNKLADYRKSVTEDIYNREKDTVEALILQEYRAIKLRELKVAQETAQINLNALSVKDLDLRQEELAVALKRQEVGSAFNDEMEKTVRASVKLNQATAEGLALEKARALAAGEALPQTKVGNIELASQVQMDLNPALKSQSDYLTAKAALESAEFIQADEKNKLLEQLEYQHQQKMNSIKLTAFEQQLKMAGVTDATILDVAKTTMQQSQMVVQGGIVGIQGGLSMLSGFLEQAGKNNKKAFEAQKAVAIAQTIISTYQAATQAFAAMSAIPFIGPALGFAAAATIVAAGMANVAAIKNQQYSGRQLGGPVMGGTPYMVGENGPELFTPNTTGSITRNQDLGGSSPTNINFTIIANDTQGFDQLLSSRKGVIQQIISDAMLERGQRSIV